MMLFLGAFSAPVSHCIQIVAVARFQLALYKETRTCQNYARPYLNHERKIFGFFNHPSPLSAFGSYQQYRNHATYLTLSTFGGSPSLSQCGHHLSMAPEGNPNFYWRSDLCRGFFSTFEDRWLFSPYAKAMYFNRIWECC